MAEPAKYVLDNAAPQTGGRFSALEELFDGLTFRHLEPLVQPGMRCLEVGGGSGSIARWLANRVGTTGRVTVTDIDTRHLETLTVPNLEVRRHDIVTDPLEENAYDLAHTRLVLLHIPERRKALERMVSALKPGGWILLQEFDSLSLKPDPEDQPTEVLMPCLQAMWANLLAHGANPGFGRSLFPLLRELGLEEVQAEGHVTMFTGGSAGARLMRANFEQLHDTFVSEGRVTEAEYQADMARLEDPSVTWPSQTLWTAKGRKPGG